jgi:beta-phosphoglucomutase-like phosphatase (HAD superfamily)
MTEIDLSGVSAVITDWDGTVVDNTATRFHALSGALRPDGIALRPDWYTVHSGLPVRALLAALPTGLTPPQVDQVIAASRRLLLTGPPPTPVAATLALLHRARTEQIPCAVASSAARVLVEAGISALQLRAVFAAVVTAECTPRGKPAPDLYIEAARRLATEPATCLAVDDAPDGIAAARAAGMRVLTIQLGQLLMWITVARPSSLRRRRLTTMFATPPTERGDQRVQRLAARREAVDDGMLVGGIPGDETLLFEAAQGPAARIGEALALPGAVRIDLPSASHRDPTGVLPAAADAARERRFDDPAIATAVRTDRIRLTRVSSQDVADVVVELVKTERIAGHSVSVFTHTNQATATLSDVLADAGVRHELVGLTEAYGEAINAQLALLRFALNRTAGVRRALAVYVTANSKGRRAPPFALQILNGSNPTFERAVGAVVAELRDAVQPVLDVDRLADGIAGAFAGIGTFRGQETWTEVAHRTRRAMRHLTDGAPVSAVEEELDQLRANALVGNAQLPPHRVQVMNLHQTKGREADATLLLLQPDEFHGDEDEPFPKMSRLLYVVLTRARQRAHIVVPEQVHPLWRPLIEVCDSLSPNST